MQTISATTTAAVFFTATHPGIYAVYAEHVSGGTFAVASSRYPSNVQLEVGNSDFDERLLFLGQGETLSASSTTSSSADVSLVRLGDEF